MLTKIILTLTTLSIFQPAFAAVYDVDCKSYSRHTQATLKYSIKSADSHRIASDINVGIRNQQSLLSSIFVAQYLAKPNVLYLMIDDTNENRILEFKGHPNHKWRGQFFGTLSEVSAGRLTGRTEMVCSINYRS